MASWQTLDDLNPDSLLDTMRDIADAGESIAAILDAIVTLLEAIAPLLVFPDNPLKAIINAIIDAVAGFIDDLLSNNIAVCFHSNALELSMVCLCFPARSLWPLLSYVQMPAASRCHHGR